MTKTMHLLNLMAAAALLLAACSTTGSAATSAQPGAKTPLTPTETLTASSNTAGQSTTVAQPTASTGTVPPLQAGSPSPEPLPTATASLPPEDWQSWPVIPTVSPAMVEVYRRGLELGRDPRAFAKVGDCQNIANFFLGVFETPTMSRLGAYEVELTPVLEQFSGSYKRSSVAVKGGFNVASVLNPINANPEQCEKGETPLACELRLQNPSIVFVSMETWWAQRPADVYEKYLSQIVEYALEQGVVPILATKADNLEGDHGINAAVARVAAKYQVPMWNFWLAVQDLPSQGVSEDGFHLTFANSYFDDPKAMEKAWPVRNLTALQALDAVWRGLNR